jgi:hypothetical protein
MNKNQFRILFIFLIDITIITLHIMQHFDNM